LQRSPSQKPGASKQQRAAAEQFELGNARSERGDLAGAAEAYRKAVKLQRDHVPALSNLGSVLRRLGELEEAARCHRAALRFDSKQPGIHYNLAIVLAELGRREQAEEAYRRCLQLAPDMAQAHGNLGLLLREQKRLPEAVGSLRRAVELEPRNLVRRRNLQETLGRLVPAWHLPMLNDAARNEAYDTAIRKAVRPGIQVLDIGTGSGLLAMMAARAGAAKVTSCEMVDVVAEQARHIVALNGFADRITVLSKASTDLKVGRDLETPADLLVSEILSNELIGEGVVPALRHAHAELLAPGAASLPCGGEVRAMLAGGDGLARQLNVETACGFDVSPFNGLRRATLSLRVSPEEFEGLSEDLTVFSLEAPFHYDPPEHFSIEFEVVRAGRCYGVLQWIRILLDETISITNDPRVERAGSVSHWNQLVYPFERPLDLAPGQRVRVSVASTGSALAFGLPEVL